MDFKFLGGFHATFAATNHPNTLDGVPRRQNHPGTLLPVRTTEQLHMNCYSMLF